MKFLCVTCDESMKLGKTMGPDAGSLTAIFTCEGCGWEMAMLTNPFETQVVGSMGVKLGGQKGPVGPMEMLRSSLEGHRKVASSDSEGTQEAESEGGGCPFAAMFSET